MLAPAGLQRLIASSPMTTHRVLTYLSRRGIAHSGQISGATLAAVCDVDARTWRKWVGGEQQMPGAAWRLLVEVSGVDVRGQHRAPSKDDVRAPLSRPE